MRPRALALDPRRHPRPPSCSSPFYGYNRLVRLRNEAVTGWANIDVQLQRRTDLDPEPRRARAYAAHERVGLRGGDARRAALQQAATPGTAAAANEGLSAALGRLFAVAEAYPEPGPPRTSCACRRTRRTPRTRSAPRAATTTPRSCTSIIGETFPWLLLARPLGFREREFFSAEGDTAPPQVSFASTLQEQIRSNRFRSAVVVAGFTVLLLLVAGLIGLVLDVSLAVVAPAAAALYGIFGSGGRAA